MQLSTEEKGILLKAAREAILQEFSECDVTKIDYKAYPKLKLELGAFVTLHINNQLRGCIGYIFTDKSLFETIVEAAKHSAFGDPRFPELSREEFEKINIEISVLSQFEPIKSYDEIEVGKHGLLLDEGGRAVLLPQVATEQNYNRSQFLTALCHKAGLYGKYWKERMLNIKVFTANVFSEEEKKRLTMNNVRLAQVAGYFYPSDPEKLKKEISLLLDITKPKEKIEKIFGIVSPHAGYVYSGKTAAHAYNLLIGKKFKRVVIISPSHSEYFPGICIFEGDAYETPLGILEVDKEFSNKLETNDGIIFKGYEGHRKEHALEVQLPFLQSVLKDFKIIPVVMGDQSKRNIDTLAQKLAEVSDEETLIVASSDLSHFYTKSQAEKLDSIVEKRVRDFDFESLQKDLETKSCEACGGGPIVTLMKAAKLKNYKHSMVLHRCDSSDVTGDNKEVVGYLSAVFYGD